MIGKIEYLEKYSVAPPPSRDYYGLKVLHDEVILFLWKISHGPHKAPTIQITKFSDFNEDKSLQDEIRRVFGNYLLEHVQNITTDKSLSILTLPKNIIARISKYLRLKDIINLSTLSRASNEVFDNDVVWETLYKKYKKSKISKVEKQYVMASSWKQLFKDSKLQESIKSQKPLVDKPKTLQPTMKDRSRQSGINLSSLQKQSCLPSKKSAEDSKKLLTTKPSSKLNISSKISSEKGKIESKNISSTPKIPDDSKKKVIPANKLKNDSKKIEIDTNRSQPNKNISSKINSLSKPRSSINFKSTENQKSTRSSISNILDTKLKSNSLRNEKLFPNSKMEKKEVGMPKKIGKSNSASLSNDKSSLNDIDIDDIGSLIEESLKNFKSPRSIFNFDFSTLADQKSAGDSKSLVPRPEIRNLKMDSSNVERISNSSARSESDDGSLEMAHFTQKYLQARDEFMKKMSEASNLTLTKNQGLSKSSSSGKLQKPLSTIPENLKKDRASIFASKEAKGNNFVQERAKIRSSKGRNVL